MNTEENRAPSVTRTAFVCPHCDVYTTQFWFQPFAMRVKGDPPVPRIPTQEFLESIENDKNIPNELRYRMLKQLRRELDGQPFVTERNSGEHVNYNVANVFLSECYDCKRLAVWVHSRLIYPEKRSGPSPSADLPDDIRRDFEEARSIVDLSPRGAAALLRLCVQRLCIFLGEKGKSIDDDIASLVAKGLNPRVQQALDIVRVIGNESVHPGELDLNDDRDTANELFGLLNSIADQLISHPKEVERLYGKLPTEKRAAIEKRDAKLALKHKKVRDMHG